MPAYPCKNCSSRTLGCHGTCEEYLKIKQTRDNLIEQERQDKKGLYQSWELRQESIERTKRWCHNRGGKRYEQ